METHRGSLLLFTDLWGYLSPKRTPLGFGSPQGHTRAHKHACPYTHTNTHPEGNFQARGRAMMQTQAPGQHSSLQGRGQQEAPSPPRLLAGLTLGSCRPAGGNPAPPSAPGPPEASLPSSGPHTSTCRADHPGPGGTAWGGSCRCGRSWGWG